MNLLALDLSLTATGVAHGSGLTTTLKFPKLRGALRLIALRNAIYALLSSLDIDLVVLEDYAYSRANQAHAIGELGGVVRVLLWEMRIPFVLVGIGQLKKYALGKGGGKGVDKDAVLLAATRRLNFEGTNNNEADALVMLRMAQDHYGLPGACVVPAKHREVLTKISWPKMRA